MRPTKIARALAFSLLLALGAGCQVDTYTLREDYAGPPPLPPELSERFAYPAANPHPVEPTLEPIPERETPTHRRYLGRFEAENPAVGGPCEVRFEFFESKVGSGRRPTVMILPILAGKYPECDYLGEQFTAIGMHAFFVHREDNLLDHRRAGAEMERILRKAIISCRRTLDYVAARPDVDPERIGFIGISLGAIIGSALVAVEPRLQANVFLMGGADLAGIILESRESPVRWYRHKRMSAEDMTPSALQADIAAALVSDPKVLAPYVDARRVLMFIAKYDNKVPTRYQWLLWERMGRPKAYACPCGHYTSIWFLDFAREKVLAFYRTSFGLPADGPAPSAAPPPAAPVAAATKE